MVDIVTKQCLLDSQATQDQAIALAIAGKQGALKDCSGNAIVANTPVVTCAELTVSQATQDQAIAANAVALLNKADLVAGKVPASQMPSYVDDVLEFANLSAFPAVGEAGKIYIDTATNTPYRWTGTTYVSVASDKQTLSVAGNVLTISGGNSVTINNGELSVLLPASSTADNAYLAMPAGAAPPHSVTATPTFTFNIPAGAIGKKARLDIVVQLSFQSLETVPVSLFGGVYDASRQPVAKLPARIGTFTPSIDLGHEQVIAQVALTTATLTVNCPISLSSSLAATTANSQQLFYFASATLTFVA